MAGMIPALSVLATATPPAATTVPTRDEAADVIDAYVRDNRSQRVRMGVTGGLVQAGLTAGAAVLGAAFGTPGVVTGTVAGALGGIAVGIHNARKYNQGKVVFMTACFNWMMGGFGALVSAASAMEADMAAGLLVAVGTAALAGVLSAAFRSSQIVEAREKMQDLRQCVERAIEVEHLVLENAKNAERAKQPGGKVEVSEDFVVVGGVKVPQRE